MNLNPISYYNPIIVPPLTKILHLPLKPADTPTISNLKFEDILEDPEVDQEAYQKLVGKLIFL
jgi:hypothetical protein